MRSSFRNAKSSSESSNLACSECKAGITDAETVNAVFRAVHSIKGGAGIFALDGLVRFAHVFETSLDAIRSGKMQAEQHVMALLLRAADVLMDLVRAARKGETVPESRTQGLVGEFKSLAAGGGAKPAVATPAAPPPPPVEAASKRTWIVRLKPHASLYAKANEAALLLRELLRLGEAEVEIDTSQLPSLADLDPEGAYLSWTVTLTTDRDAAAVREVFDFVEDDCELEVFERPQFNFFGMDEPAPETAETAAAPVDSPVAITPEAAPVHHEAESIAVPHPVDVMAAQAEAPASVSATIRVDLDRVDRMIDLVGELVITEAMLSQRVLEAGLARTSAVAMALEELEALTREIQDSVMAIRAQPVRSVFQRMPRLVRELAIQTGKQVRLIMEGEGTEVDKTVIERISDPLTHMIRNAIDHGLESTTGRVAAGKPAEGLVRLTALHRSGRIVIEVADDGAGINRPRVRAKAVERGLISAEAQLTDDEIDNLIFLPGFLHRRHGVGYFGPRRRHGRGATLGPGHGRPAHFDHFASRPRVRFHPQPATDLGGAGWDGRQDQRADAHHPAWRRFGNAAAQHRRHLPAGQSQLRSGPPRRLRSNRRCQRGSGVRTAQQCAGAIRGSAR